MDDPYVTYQKAREAMSNGDFLKAVQLFESSDQELHHFKSFELLGECLMKLRRFTEAIAPLSTATSLNKGVRAPSLLSEVFYNLNDRKNAKKFAAIALKRDPKNKKALKIRLLVEEKNKGAS